MKGFSNNIEKLTLENGNFRKVLYTAPHSQLVLMNLKPNFLLLVVVKIRKSD